MTEALSNVGSAGIAGVSITGNLVFVTKHSRHLYLQCIRQERSLQRKIWEGQKGLGFSVFSLVIPRREC